MAAKNLADVVSSLTPDEQESVKQFVAFLKGKKSASLSPFLTAADEFIDQHPELLRRLAQRPPIQPWTRSSRYMTG